MKNLSKTLTLESLSINDHTIDSFLDRNKSANIEKSSFIIPKETEIAILVQRNIKSRPCKILKGAITLENGLIALINIYKKENLFFSKTLTILTPFQLKVSWNLGFGNHLKTPLKATIKKQIKQNIWFDDTYTDYLNTISWTEMDVINYLQPCTIPKDVRKMKVRGLKGSFKIKGESFYVYG